VLFTSCDYINPEESIPSYISIDKIELDHEDAIGISDAWVYVNYELIGVFELPAEFPVLANGEAEIMVSPGIKVNGISVTRTFYPFYNAYTITQNLSPGETTKLNPKVGYNASITNIVWKEEFEGDEIKFTHDTTYKFGFVKNADMAFEENYCGMIALDSTTQEFEEKSLDYIEKPDIATYGSYLEMNFNTNMYFAVGLIVNYQNTLYNVSLVDLNPTDGKWKKIYIDLYTALNDFPDGTYFKIAINNLDYSSYLAFDQTLVLNPKIYIDDFKIIQ
jgi:hypothetical protein